MTIQLPSINIQFVKKASTAIQRSNRGIVALILKDSAENVNGIKVKTENDIPTTITADNQELVRLCLIGNEMKPLKVELYTASTSNTLEDILNVIEISKIDYICYPDATTEEKESIKTKVVQLREDGVKVKFVAATLDADNEAIINFTTDNIVVGEKTYTNAQYSARIAGMIAGTPLSQSITYAELPEISSIPYTNKSDAETKVNNGELILFKQANVIRIARGVNSLNTVTSTKTNDFKKIKLVDTMDLIESDIYEVCINNYIGKVPNTYDNKCVLIAAIGDYLTGISKERLIEDDFSIDIDLEAQEAYLKANNEDTDDMTDNEIKKANTDDKVFLAGRVNLVDSVEEISIKFYI